jgi:hypothetical protein
MVNRSTCPSHLVLARISAGGLPSPEHVRTCPRCSSALGRLQAPVATPEWARALAQSNPSASGVRWRWWAAASVVAVAAVALLVLPQRLPIESFTESSITAKGIPSVAVYLKRGASVSLWDGQRPLHPGDRIRLKVMPESFGEVAVVALGPGGPNVLHRGSIPPGEESFLPTSWRVGETPVPNRLAVVFSLSPLGEAELLEALRAERRSDSVWTTSFALSPSSPPGAP